MKIFIAALFGAIITANSAMAMTFSQPERLGGAVRWSQSGGFYILGESVDNHAEKNYSASSKNFLKGVAQFGDETDKIFEHYDANKDKNVRVGDKDEKNTITLEAVKNLSLHKVENDGEIRMYMIRKGNETHEEDGYIVFARRKDGRFVKYFDTDDIRTKNFQDGSNIAFGEIKFEGDTVKIVYERRIDSYKYAKVGEFRFKWDDKAQWFGIEQVNY